MNTYAIGYNSNIKSNSGVKNTNNYINPSLLNNKGDVYFNGLNKTFIMSKAKSVKDIPKDANIFIFSCKSKVKFPEGRSAKECILTEKGFGFWKKFFGGNAANTVNLKRNSISYVHGEVTDTGKICGILNVDSCKIGQIENISNVKIYNNSTINSINLVDELGITNSRVTKIEDVKRLTMKGNSKSDNVSVYNLSTTPGIKIKTVSTENLLCKADPNNPNKYNEIENANVSNGAEIYQAKIKELKTKELIIKDSVVDTLTADGCLEFDNAIIKNFEIYDIKKMSDCKATNILLKGYDPEICLHGKTQIENFNIKGSNVKLFIFPKKEWDRPVDNYIRNINVLSEYAENEVPRIKIQGNIDVENIIFEKKPGIVELTVPENPKKRINVINGYIKYDCPIEEAPKLEDLD